MAQKVQIILTDDLDGGEAHETLTFGLDGKTYEIDLSSGNADELRKFLEPYTKAGRRQNGKAPAGSRGRRPAVRTESEPSPEVYRKWAESNGYEVNSRGRVPASIKEAYRAANA